MSHGNRRLNAVFRHRQNVVSYILIGIAEHLVELIPQRLVVRRNLLVRNGELGQMQKVSVQPFAVGLVARI